MLWYCWKQEDFFRNVGDTLSYVRKKVSELSLTERKAELLRFVKLWYPIFQPSQLLLLMLALVTVEWIGSASDLAEM